MRTNKIKIFFIVLESIIYTLFVSSWIMLVLFCRMGKRAFVDRRSYEWSRTLLKIVKAHYHVFNPHHVTLDKHQKYIIMSNHNSLYDIPLIFMTFPHHSIRMIAKKELFRVPIWGWAMRMAEYLPIDRDNRRQAVKDLELIRTKIEDGIIPWIAPEGTRSRDGKLHRFKKGGFVLAKQVGAMIIPVGIRGSDSILPPKTWQVKLNQKVDIHIEQPIDASKSETTEELMLAVHKAILRASDKESVE